MRIASREPVTPVRHRYMSAPERFEAGYVPITESGCWLWLGATVKGYGQFRANGKAQLAHRYALAEHLGRDLLPGMLACHKCDTPSCVNPGHLFEGTVQDNSADQQAKGRQLRGQALSRTFKSRCQGAEHHSCKLSEAEVVAIRNGPLGLRTTGRQYGVSATTVSKIRNGLIWKSVTTEESKT